MSHETPDSDFIDDMADLVSAEDFLDYFGVEYDARVVQVNRLHILQRFHNYLQGAGGEPDRETWRALLVRAYEDFVHSDAQTEAVFRVFQRAQGIAKVSISSIGRKPSSC
ncbi:MAG: nitrogen fixation protein NifW [Candidatus Dactylopiibacterium carminicum]|uniref:Nitrogenase-stabilizing/protective protein NifW n=1 Tax=Candidatus Dactylopiibacterium carminicum TaxID=857335 RepID=A0A272EXE9_9RHOO|nr:nitrogenase-stabilizing/protective protein NifW [Candidatus Dactylopiibacterium carminicum]KAF7600189.1 nitrogen fixation protein NifW [Candidatus Dactylopiibacterium carminicum]PAS94792.1 MAG: nitrogen fixation protein NifW [Candidatus Dactylopiibacterium carminicum]PAS97716.1 MAG: nitrogen fixation protein NifW [Candidatus Dactylopiibacterium carminicum]PAT00190.1 MAG: nitrogen fixation protein NifW [Candidatus Dactylopiibacterium carminicum]